MNLKKFHLYLPKEGEIEIDKFQNKGLQHSQTLRNQSKFQECKNQLSKFCKCLQKKLGFFK